MSFFLARKDQVVQTQALMFPSAVCLYVKREMGMWMVMFGRRRHEFIAQLKPSTKKQKQKKTITQL